MADRTFIPDPNNPLPYLGQMFLHDYPGADQQRAAQAWSYAKQHGLNDAQCYRYMAAACGYEENGQPAVQLTPEQKQAAKWSGVDEKTYADHYRELVRQKQAGNIQS
jgi:hypothetical protein